MPTINFEDHFPSRNDDSLVRSNTNYTGINFRTPTNFHLGGVLPGSPLSVIGGQGTELSGSDSTNFGVNLVLSNSSPSPNAFVDLYIQNDIADASGTHFGTLNYNSSHYNSTFYGSLINVPNQLALYGTDGPTMIGAVSSTANGYINFATGGTSTTNERMRITSAGAVQVNGGPLQTTVKTALGTTGTVSLDPTLGNLFTCTPTGAITLNAASVSTGQLIYIVVTSSGASSFNITPNTNFRSTGSLATGTSTGKVFVLTFISDGTNFNEVSRTTAQ